MAENPGLAYPAPAIHARQALAGQCQFVRTMRGTVSHQRHAAHERAATHIFIEPPCVRGAAPQPVCAARPASLCTVFLDPGRRRRQRQPVQVRLHRDGYLPARRVLAAAVPGGPGDRGAVHPAVPAVFGHGRAAHRQVREDAHHPFREEPGDRHHAGGGSGLHGRPCRAAAGLRVPDGPAFHAVRAGQVRLPAAGLERARAHRRQWHGGDGHLRRHLAGQCGRRPAGGHARRGSWRRRPGLPGPGAGRAAGGAVHSRRAGHRPGTGGQLEPGERDLAQPPAGARQHRRLPLAAGHLVDVVLRRGVPLPVPQLCQGCAARRRAGGVGPAGGVLAGHRHGRAAVRGLEPAPYRDWPGAAGGDWHERVRW